MELPFFTNLLILLVVAKLLGEIAERFRQPAMIGEIFAGILLGPAILHLIHRTEEIRVITELGVFLLVIQAGLEIQTESMIQTFKRKNILMALFSFFIPNFMGIGLGLLFHLNILSTLFLGLCIAISALPVSIRMLMDIGKLHSPVGQQIISVAIFNDLLALAFFGILLNIKGTDMSFLAISKATALSALKISLLMLFMILMYFLFKKITHKGNYLEESLNKLILWMKGKEPLFALFFAYILLFSTISENFGFHFIVGAFFGAILISEKIIGKVNHQSIEKTIGNMSMGFLAPVFFAGIGLEFNFYSLHNLPFLISVIAVAFVSKFLGGFLGAVVSGSDLRTSLIMGIGLNARGIMELVIANIAYNSGIISKEIFFVLVIMGIFTTLLTPFLLRKIFH